MQKKIPSELLELLADGEFHSGEAIGSVLGVSRAAVWKKLQGLEDLGIKVESVKGKGYRLLEPSRMLDKSYITDCLQKLGVVTDVSVHDVIDSTNAELLRRLQCEQAVAGSVVLAESQSSGRGRRGRKWVSPLAKNLNFSMSWSFNTGVASLDGLSLLVGLSLIKALEAMGLQKAELKWPNDVLVDNKKLAGVLLEITGDPTGFCHVVIGVGVNVHMKDTVQVIEQPWVSVCHLLGGSVDRNELVVSLVAVLMSNLKRFETYGFKPFADDWKKYDSFCGQDVVISLGEKQILGVARGVTDSGEFKLETDSGIQVFNGGEVSLRRR